MDIMTLGREPIAGAIPVGNDIRHEDIFESLSQEIAKRNALSASGGVNWNKVVELSSTILADHAKDLLVASYLCVGLYNCHGLSGLANGITIYCELVANFWLDLYPKRANGRLNAINWLNETLCDQLERQTEEVWTSEAKAKLENDLTELASLLAKTDLAEQLDIQQLTSLLLKAINVGSEASPQSAAEPSRNIAEVAPQTALNWNTAPSEPLPFNFADQLSPQERSKALSQAFQLLTKVRESLLSEQQLSYQSFIINRFIAWLEISDLPACDNNKQTMLLAPAEHNQQALARLYQDKKWLDLIKTSEGLVVEYRFWLDLSFYSYKGLMALGYTAIAQELADASLGLTQRLIGIEELAFEDGTPFASIACREWITSLSTGGQTKPALVLPDGDSGLQVELANENQIVQQLIDAGDEQGAINLLYNHLQTSGPGQARFWRTLQFCQVVAKTSYFKLVKPYVHELLAMLDEYHLAEWQPQAAIAVYTLTLDLHRYQKISLADSQYEAIINAFSLVAPQTALAYL